MTVSDSPSQGSESVHDFAWLRELYTVHVGLSMSNEQIFRNPHALRPRILFNFLVCCPIIQTRQVTRATHHI